MNHTLTGESSLSEMACLLRLAGALTTSALVPNLRLAGAAFFGVGSSDFNELKRSSLELAEVLRPLKSLSNISSSLSLSNADLPFLPKSSSSSSSFNRDA